MDVGFIGAGRMGRVMIANLVRAGHRVRAFDATPDAVAAAVQAGAQAAASAADAFGGDAVISMLPNDKAMRALFGPGGVLPEGGSATVHVNMATASVDCATDLTAFHAERGVAYVAAPVFGRPEMAAERQINIMVAGTKRRSPASSRCSMRWARRPGASAPTRARRTSPRSPAT